MKLGLKMEGKENSSMQMSSESTVKKALPKRWLFAAILGLLVIVLITGATVLGIFLGKNMTKEVYKEAWVTFHDTYTDTVMKERYIVQDQEFYITKPGEVGIIYDYGRNQVVMQVDGIKEDDGDDCNCMMFDFDQENALSLNEVASYINQTYIYHSGNFTRERMVLEQTGTYIDPQSLSRKSKEMCLGCTISKMHVTKGTDVGHTREKRRADAIISYCLCGTVCTCLCM